MAENRNVSNMQGKKKKKKKEKKQEMPWGPKAYLLLKYFFKRAKMYALVKLYFLGAALCQV